MLAKRLSVAVVLATLVCPVASADVQLAIADGRVSLVAKDATIRQIMAEWARIGQTTVVNLERIPGVAVTLQLTNVTEEQALDVLLRSVSGYMAARRPVAAQKASRFDRIIVMPPSTPPRVVAAPVPAFPQPVVPSPAAPVAGLPGAGDDDNDPTRPAGAAGAAIRGPVFTFPQPQVVAPPAAVGAVGSVPAQAGPPAGLPPPTGVPPASQGSPPGATAPFGGVARPGMIVPTPQATSPGAPGQPTVPEGP
jgi:hypothetical protein